MSTRSTIFLTVENEHWYRDCSYENDKDGNVITDFLDLEFLNKNAEIAYQDEDSFMVRVYPGTNLYKNILNSKEDRNVFVVEAEGKFIDVINDMNVLYDVLKRKGISLGEIKSEKYTDKVFTGLNSEGREIEISVKYTYIKSE